MPIGEVEQEDRRRREAGPGSSSRSSPSVWYAAVAMLVGRSIAPTRERGFERAANENCAASVAFPAISSR